MFLFGIFLHFLKERSELYDWYKDENIPIKLRLSERRTMLALVVPNDSNLDIVKRKSFIAVTTVYFNGEFTDVFLKNNTKNL